MKRIKSISWFLGIAMFMFGILKVLVPTIHGWFAVQMTNSGISKYIPIWVGIAGEIVSGSALIVALFTAQKFSSRTIWLIIQGASATIIIMMLTAVYVHMQPNVPADVLPLKIKAPFIPIFMLSLALTNVYLIQRKIKNKLY
ncbi:MAG TPA: hypothetical protein VKT28_05080 [Puia sp.]|nr:hypothetical protein [Puia sp.]